MSKVVSRSCCSTAGAGGVSAPALVAIASSLQVYSRKYIFTYLSKLLGRHDYKVALWSQGWNSSSPKPWTSLRVSLPDAMARISSKIRAPASCPVCVPSTMVPQLMSISSDMRLYREVFDAILREGVGLQPKTDPLPVVKQMTLAPLATCPVAETGSKPGESMKTRP